MGDKKRIITLVTKKAFVNGDVQSKAVKKVMAKHNADEI